MAVPLEKYDPLIRVTVYLDGGTKYFATRDHYDGSGNEYLGTLEQSPEISKALSDLYYGVEEATSITLKFSNRKIGSVDNWDDIITTNADEPRGRWIKVERYDPTDGSTFEFRGKITGYILGDTTTLTVQMRDDYNLDTLLPLGVVTTDTFDTTAMDLGEPINLCFGHCRNVPLRNIQNDRTNDEYDYLIGYGTIESLWVDHANGLGVKRDGVLVDTSEYTFDDGSGSPTDHGYAGYASIRFSKEQMNFSGGFHELTADVKGLELGGASAERNFATVIENILSDATWGLGDNVDATSFTNAASDLDTITDLYCDGAIIEQRTAKDIIDDLLFVCRGRIERAADGEWEITIDKTGGSSVLNLGDNDGYYNNCKVVDMSATPAENALTEATVQYGLNASDEKGTYAEELDVSVFSGFGVKRTYELPFVLEDDTAIKVLSYLKNRSIYSDVRITIEGGMECRDLDRGDIITVTAPLRNIASKEFMIENISKTLTSFRIEAREYSSNIYSDETITPPTGPSSSHYTVEGPETWVGPIQLGDGTNQAGSITMNVADGQGDIYIAAGKTDFEVANNGFILGIDDSDSNKVKLYIGNATDYFYWNATKLVISGSSGKLVLDTSVPSMAMGDATGYLTGEGFWVGKDSTLWKLHLGNPNSDYISYDGAGNLHITGEFSGSTTVDGTSANTFTINNDGTNTDIQLILNRTTGGAATFQWNGSLVSLDQNFSAQNLYIPDGGFVGISGADGWTFDSTNGDISTTSNVGIGTTGSGEKLDVNGTIIASQYKSDTTNIETVSGNYSATKMVYRFSEGRGLGYNSADNTIYFAMSEGVSMVVDNGGNVGIGTTDPRKLADFLSTSQAQLRLSYSDNSVYTDFRTQSDGDLDITPSGSRISIDANLEFVGAQSITTSADDLTLAPADDLILDPGTGSILVKDAISTDNFVSQTTGWQVSYAGVADFREIYADELFVKAFTAEVYSALAGGITITKSRAEITRDFTIPDTGNTATLYVSDHEGIADTAVFTSGDYILLKVLDWSGGGLVVTDVYGTVTSYSDLGGGEQSWTFETTTTGYSSADMIYAGSVALDYGQTGSGSRGVWEATVLDASGSPYTQIQSWSSISSGEPSSFTTHVRMGNLDGLSGIGLEYGLYAGQGLTNSDAYVLVTDSQADLHNLPLTIHDGTSVRIKADPSTPYFSVGSTAPSTFSAGDGIWMGNDSGTYKFRVGDVDGELFEWDGSDIYIRSDASNYLKAASTGIEGYGNGVKLLQLTTGGVAYFGDQDNEHVKISGTGVELKDSGTVYGKFAATTTIGNTGGGEYVSVASTGIKLYQGGNKLAELASNALKLYDSTGTQIADYGSAISIGEVGASKSNVYITSGAVQFRTNTTVKMQLKTDGSIEVSDTLDIATGGKVRINTSDGLEITSGNNVLVRDGGNIELEAGGDIKFGVSDTDPSLLNWNDIHYFGASTTTSRGLCAWPNTAGQEYFRIGFDPINNAVSDYSWFAVYTSGSTYIASTYDANNRAIISTYAVTSNCAVYFEVERAGTTSILRFEGIDLCPVTGTVSLGTISYKWDQGWFSGYVIAEGGIHVGGISDPGTDNLLVDGKATISGAAPASPTANSLYKDNIVKAWIRFDGTGTISIDDDFNVSSITDISLGQYTITWATDFANTNYAVVATAGHTTAVYVMSPTYNATPLVGSSTVGVVHPSGPAWTDSEYISVIAIGDQ